MSTRVCYMIRDERGGRLRSLRLVGQGVDVSYPDDGRAEPGDGIDMFSAAAWLRDQLEQARSTRSLTMLVLDDSGAVCSWVTTPSFDPGMIASAARRDAGAIAPDDDDRSGPNSRPDINPVTYFAADPLESNIQSLSADIDSGDPADASEPRRVAVLAAADTPVRLLLDALDSVGITVEHVTSLWQASALAWDSSAPPALRATLLPDAAPIDIAPIHAVSTSATIVSDGARLAWAWSRSGRLVCGGSVRVAPAPQPIASDSELAPLGGGSPGASGSSADAPAIPMADAADVPRLVAEWLSWSIQTGAAPARITCLLAAPDRAFDATESAARFGAALGKAWAGATVDVVTSTDPVGATLRRVSEVLDSTPAKPARSKTPLPSAGLHALEQRPGRSHRAMYIWTSVALVAFAAGLGVVSWRMSAAAASAKIAAEEWRKKWEVVAKDSFPDALQPKAGLSPSTQMWDEVRRLEDARRPADRAEPALPVMQELETLSYVLSDPAYGIESVDLDSKGTIKVIAIANDIASAELLLESINALAGTNTVDWTATYRMRAGGGENKVTATFNAKWDPSLLTPAKPPQ